MLRPAVVFVLCLVVYCVEYDSTRYGRFGHHSRSRHAVGQGSDRGLGRGTHYGRGSRQNWDDDSGEDVGYGLVGGSEDVFSDPSIGEIDFGDAANSDNDNFHDSTLHRYMLNNRRHRYGRRYPGRHQRHHHQPRQVVKRQILDEEVVSREQNSEESSSRQTDGVGLTDALTGGRRDGPQRRPHQRNWRRRFGRRRHPWLAGLGVGMGGSGSTVIHSPMTHSHRHFKFNFGSHGLQFGVSSFGSMLGPDGSFSARSHWTSGPNVCKSTRTYMKYLGQGTSPFAQYSINCEDRTTFYTCTSNEENTVNNTAIRNTTIQTQNCCHGYTRETGDEGCPRSLNLINMTQTVDSLGVTQFIKALYDSQLNFTLTRPNMTLFVPTNAALNSYQPSTVDLSNYIVLNPREQEAIMNEGQRLLEGHIVGGVTLATDAMVNDQILETLHPENTIRINKYPNKVVTANCARLVQPDNFAKTGVVHVISDVIVQERGTVYDFIKHNRQITMFHDALSNTSLAQELRNPNAGFTVFAPTNEAFEKLRPELRQRLFRDRDGNCMKNVLSEHVVNSVWCSAGIQNGTVVPNILNNPLVFTRDLEENLFVNDIRVVTDDYVTANGVVHIINDIIAISAAFATDLAEENDASMVVSLFSAANMVGAINDLVNVTFILPVDKAFQAISPENIDTLRANSEKLRQLLEFHIVNGTYTSSEMRNGIHLPTKAGTNLTVTETVARPRRPIFRDRRTELMRNIQCARIVKKDLWTCSGKTVVHLIDKVLLPPIGNILDVLRQDELNYSQFLAMVRRANMTDLLGRISQTDITLFLPTNQALEVMPTQMKERLSDVGVLKKFIRAHIVNAPICCSSAQADYWGAPVGVRTLSGDVIPWQQQEDQTVQVGQIPVQTCDITATNGIVHIIDGYLGGKRLAQEPSDPLDLDHTFNFDLDDLFPNWFD